jgi:hypothetical protein
MFIQLRGVIKIVIGPNRFYFGQREHIYVYIQSSLSTSNSIFSVGLIVYFKELGRRTRTFVYLETIRCDDRKGFSFSVQVKIRRENFI